MKKLKITQAQYNRLHQEGKLKPTIVNENINKINKLKITKEQCSRLFNKNLLKENNGITNKFNNEVIELIKALYTNPNNIDSFWIKNGLIPENIINVLISKNLITKNGDVYNVPRTIEPQSAIQAISDELSGLIQNNSNTQTDSPELDEVEIEGQDDGELEDVSEPKLTVVGYNGELAILKGPDGVLYSLAYGDMDKDIISSYVNDNLETISKGDGIEGWSSGKDLVKIDNDLEQELMSMYDKDKNIVKAFKSKKIENEGVTIGTEPQKGTVSTHWTAKEVEPKRRTNKDNSAILDKLATLYDRERQQNPPTRTKHPLDKHPDDIDEMTGTASSGAFTGPVSFGGAEDDVIKRDIPVVGETTVAGAGNFQYDAPGLANVGRNGEFKKGPKTKAQTKTQYPSGSFVETSSCTKLNNNKEAQNGKCSQGAVDGVVHQKKTNGSIISPSLNEGFMFEALGLKRNSEKNTLSVHSDLEGREASKETFTNKNILKQNGFMWDGNNWVISADKLDIANNTLQLINKAHKVINVLEDIEEELQSTEEDEKTKGAKNLLKARLDQYITDLANATDEATLSAEIRRYLTFFSKFHSYSFHNRILIFIQRPEATKVASYNTWKSKHRQVNKGAKGITILAPSSAPKAVEWDDETTEIMGQMGMSNRPTVSHFRAVNVFDIADTTAIDERGDVPETPEWWGANTPSETADMLFGAVVEVSKDLGINVTQDVARGGERGFSAGDHINISSDVSGAGRLSTIIHEIAHELMHWKKSSIYYQGDDVKSDSAMKELQAESVSYVVLKHYGIPASHHATYLALWKANSEKIHKNLEYISKVSQFIIDKIEQQVSNSKNQ